MCCSCREICSPSLQTVSAGQNRNQTIPMGDFPFGIFRLMAYEEADLGWQALRDASTAQPSAPRSIRTPISDPHGPTTCHDGLDCQLVEVQISPRASSCVAASHRCARDRRGGLRLAKYHSTRQRARAISRPHLQRSNGDAQPDIRHCGQFRGPDNHSSARYVPADRRRRHGTTCDCVGPRRLIYKWQQDLGRACRRSDDVLQGGICQRLDRLSP